MYVPKRLSLSEKWWSNRVVQKSSRAVLAVCTDSMAVSPAPATHDANGHCTASLALGAGQKELRYFPIPFVAIGYWTNLEQSGACGVGKVGSQSFPVCAVAEGMTTGAVPVSD